MDDLARRNVELETELRLAREDLLEQQRNFAYLANTWGRQGRLNDQLSRSLHQGQNELEHPKDERSLPPIDRDTPTSPSRRPSFASLRSPFIKTPKKPLMITLPDQGEGELMGENGVLDGDVPVDISHDEHEHLLSILDAPIKVDREASMFAPLTPSKHVFVPVTPKAITPPRPKWKPPVYNHTYICSQEARDRVQQNRVYGKQASGPPEISAVHRNKGSTASRNNEQSRCATAESFIRGMTQEEVNSYARITPVEHERLVGMRSLIEGMTAAEMTPFWHRLARNSEAGVAAKAWEFHFFWCICQNPEKVKRAMTEDDIRAEKTVEQPLVRKSILPKGVRSQRIAKPEVKAGPQTVTMVEDKKTEAECPTNADNAKTETVPKAEITTKIANPHQKPGLMASAWAVPQAEVQSFVDAKTASRKRSLPPKKNGLMSSIWAESETEITSGLITPPSSVSDGNVLKDSMDHGQPTYATADATEPGTHDPNGLSEQSNLVAPTNGLKRSEESDGIDPAKALASTVRPSVDDFPPVKILPQPPSPLSVLACLPGAVQDGLSGPDPSVFCTVLLSNIPKDVELLELVDEISGGVIRSADLLQTFGMKLCRTSLAGQVGEPNNESAAELPEKSSSSDSVKSSKSAKKGKSSKNNKLTKNPKKPFQDESMDDTSTQKSVDSRPTISTNSALVLFLQASAARAYVEWRKSNPLVFNDGDRPVQIRCEIVPTPTRTLDYTLQNILANGRSLTRAVVLEDNQKWRATEVLEAVFDHNKDPRRLRTVKSPLRRSRTADGLMYFEFASMQDAKTFYDEVTNHRDFFGPVPKAYFTDPSSRELGSARPQVASLMWTRGMDQGAAPVDHWNILDDAESDCLIDIGDEEVGLAERAEDAVDAEPAAA